MQKQSLYDQLRSLKKLGKAVLAFAILITLFGAFSAGYPIPVGFSEADINKTSPPLFSDWFMLYYLHTATRLGLEFHSVLHKNELALKPIEGGVSSSCF